MQRNINKYRIANSNSKEVRDYKSRTTGQTILNAYNSFYFHP